MVNTEIRLIIFFAAKDGEALYSQQKQDQELTVGGGGRGTEEESALGIIPASGPLHGPSLCLGCPAWDPKLSSV